MIRLAGWWCRLVRVLRAVPAGQWRAGQRRVSCCAGWSGFRWRLVPGAGVGDVGGGSRVRRECRSGVGCRRRTRGGGPRWSG